jgi:hypothetical protein
MDATSAPVGGTVEHNGFEVISNTETPEEMREVLGVEPEAEEASKAAALLGKKGGQAAAEKRKLAPIPDRKPAAGDDAPDGSAKGKDAKPKLAEPEGKEAKPEPEAKEAKPEPDEDADAPAGETKEQKAERKRSARARVEQATRESAELKRRLAARERENEELRRKISPPKPEPVGEPRVEDYEEPEKYLEARDSYNRQRWEREVQTKAQQAHLEQRITAEIKTWNAAITKQGGKEWLDSLDPAVSAIEPSFVAIARGEKPSAANALADEFLRAGDNAPRLMSYFSEHPEEVQRFSTLLPYQFLREMGKVEARLEAAIADSPAPQGEVSRARKPVRSVTGAPPSVDSDEDPNEDFDKFAARRFARR